MIIMKLSVTAKNVIESTDNNFICNFAQEKI